MIVERSSATTITWTPVCGPGPVLNRVSGFPDGCWTVNPTVTGFPGAIPLDGDRSTSWYVFAGFGS